MKISGGIVTATGGEGACGVGGGYKSGDGKVEISGGTVAATAGAGGERCIDVGFVGPNGVAGGIAFTGGSILAEHAKVKPAATNAVGASVWRVDVAVPNPDPAQAVTVTGLADYGVTDIRTSTPTVTATFTSGSPTASTTSWSTAPPSTRR